MPPEPSTTVPRIVGNYELLSKIAEGGMGAVFKGRDQTSGLIVAIKIVPAETAKNPVLMRRFEQEFKAARLLDHPNVVKAIEFSPTPPNPFLVMEFVDGESLGGLVERDGPMPEEDAVHIMAQVCEGLHRAHKQGLIHRDVKPDNILVTRTQVAKLTDMGLVKDVEGELNLTRTGRGLGTPHFMAPEQFRNAKNADVRCDVYSLGATLYMVLTGDVPFAKTSPLDCWMKKVKNDFPPPKQVNPRLSDRVNWAILRAMSADPNQRPSSCREFMEDLTGAAWKTQSNPIPPEILAEAGVTPDLWYLVYKDPDGTPHTVKGSTDSIRQNIKAGAPGDAGGVLVCRTKTGQFIALRTVPEFRDLVITTDPAVPAPPVSSRGGKSTPAGAPALPKTDARGRYTAPPAEPDDADDPRSTVKTAPHKKFPIVSDPSGLTRPATGGIEKYLPWALALLAVLAAVVGVVLMLK